MPMRFGLGDPPPRLAVRVLAIDPGITGAWAYVDDGEVVIDDLEVTSIGVTNQIVPHALATVIRLYNPGVVVLEQNGVMPSNGSKANYSMGLSMGIITGVVGTLSYPLVRMRPQEWKPLVGLASVKGTTTQRKEASRQRALEILGTHEALALKKNHDRADAFLIAEAYRRRGS